VAVAALLGACSDGEQAIDDPLPPEPTFGPGDTTIPGGFDHEGSGITTDAGPECDAIGQHSQMAMWNATLADDMVELDCPWPWDPALQELDGGEADPAIDAEFEPNLYSDVFEMIGDEEFGVCEVRAVPQDDATGLVFGFDVGLRAETCGEGVPDVALSVFEYADRGFRDQAANAIDGSLVLGRWVVQVAGDDTDGVERLTAALEDTGAVTTS
jgi:hypothetical protein